MEDLISVIIPVYNVEKYIKRCLDSVIKQTYSKLEIILVDDGSTDNSGEICDEYAKKDERVIVIHKTNGGLSDARNKGIEKAKGKYIGFVDSDDWISENMYEALYNNAVKYGADISCCDFIRTRDDNEKIDRKKFDNKINIYNLDEYMKIFFKIGTQQCVYYAWNKLYKREIIQNDLYPKGLTSEDVQGTFKTLIRSNKIVSVNYPYYYYFINDNSITGKRFADKDFDLLQIWDNVVEICKDNKPEYLDMAILNRNRIDYTLLMRMAMQLSNREIISKYEEETIKLITNLKKNKKELLKSRIPISRKITIFMICNNYRFFIAICNIFQKIRRIK